ncbi:Metallo-dependent hydrolase [Gloeopeniophorella convolvens]|nr:Metallo-dependent hydrolase [Gloeopeniophorella convolvens]
MTSPNGLICFTNCLLPLEDGSLVEKDLWIDERRGVVLDAQKTFFLRKQRPARVINMDGNIVSPGLIDIQINGAYGFDFSVYEGDAEAYRRGLNTIAEKIVETGVTSLVPTIITQEQSLYPTLLSLLRPYAHPTGATLLGWHAEGPFLQMAKRGAHAPPFIRPAPKGFASFEDMYGAQNLVLKEDWLMDEGPAVGVRIITAAPEIDGVLEAIRDLSQRGVAFSIGHSIATTDIATEAVRRGARLITHLFNAMPQLHHRDPSIIGLLGASPHLAPFSPVASGAPTPASPVSPLSLTSPIHQSSSFASFRTTTKAQSEAFDDHDTPPQTPILAATRTAGKVPRLGLHLEKGQVADLEFERPFYELIVDGIHSHPNSVRLAYNVYPEGCILITDAMKILDPHLKDGVHEWRDGKRFVKEGVKLYLEGTDTLAGSVVTLDTCVRNFSRFTGCSLGEAIKCATFNPARCLGIENRKGTLRPGADADLVVLDRSGNVLSTWVRGKEVWRKD